VNPLARHGAIAAKVLCVVTHPTDYAVAIVTGGSCGASREIARTLASRGYAVVVVYLRDQGKAEAAVEEILAANGTSLAVRADVTDELDVERLFTETAAAFGDVDVVVHAALRGSSVVSQHAAHHLRHGGAIVNVSTSDAIAPVLADELRARDITVNGLAPALGATRLLKLMGIYPPRLSGAHGREDRAAPDQRARAQLRATDGTGRLRPRSRRLLSGDPTVSEKDGM